MSIFTDLEKDAASVDGFVNENALITTRRNGPKPSWQYIVDQVYGQLGYAVVGSFVDGFTYTGIRQVGVDASGNTWIYTGGQQNLPHVVAAGTVPSAPDYFQVSVNSADNVVLDNGENLQQAIDRLNAEIDDLDASTITTDSGASIQEYIDGQQFESIDAVKSYANLSALIGQRIQTKEYHAGTGYGGASYDVVASSGITPNDIDIIQGVADSGAAIVLDSKYLTNPLYLGHIDGTDSTSIVKRMLEAAPSNSKITWGRANTFDISDFISNKNAAHWDLSGSTINLTGDLGVNPGFAINFFDLDFDVDGLSGAYAVKGSNKITLPTGLPSSFEVGDIITLRSDSVFVGSYKNGTETEVMEVNGLDITVRTPFYGDFEINRIRRYKCPNYIKIENGTIRHENVQNVQGLFHAIYVVGHDMEFKNLKFYGNDYASGGLFINGDTALAEGVYVEGFAHSQQSSGRIGYGIAAHANNTVLRRCTGKRNKHTLAVGGTLNVKVGVRYEECTAYDENPELFLFAPMDFHASALSPVAENCNVYGDREVISLRADVKYINCNFYQTKADSGKSIFSIEDQDINAEFHGGSINAVDSDTTALRITGTTAATVSNINKLEFYDVDINLGSTNFFDMFKNGSDLFNIKFIGGSINCNYLINATNVNAFDGLIIKNLDPVECSASLVKILCTSGIKNITVKGNDIASTATTTNQPLMIFRAPSQSIPISNLIIEGNDFDVDFAAYTIRVEDGGVDNLHVRGNTGTSTPVWVSVSDSDINNLSIQGNSVWGDIEVLNSGAASTADKLTVTGNAASKIRVESFTSKTNALVSLSENNCPDITNL